MFGKAYKQTCRTQLAKFGVPQMLLQSISISKKHVVKQNIFQRFENVGVFFDS